MPGGYKEYKICDGKYRVIVREYKTIMLTTDYKAAHISFQQQADGSYKLQKNDTSIPDGFIESAIKSATVRHSTHKKWKDAGMLGGEKIKYEGKVVIASTPVGGATWIDIETEDLSKGS